MGTWGTGILSDDLARDIYDEYIEQYNEGASHDAIFAKIEKDYADSIVDPDEGVVFGWPSPKPSGTVAL